MMGRGSITNFRKLTEYSEGLFKIYSDMKAFNCRYLDNNIDNLNNEANILEALSMSCYKLMKIIKNEVSNRETEDACSMKSIISVDNEVGG